jgi:hypothetical protein
LTGNLKGGLLAKCCEDAIEAMVAVASAGAQRASRDQRLLFGFLAQTSLPDLSRGVNGSNEHLKSLDSTRMSTLPLSATAVLALGLTGRQTWADPNLDEC